MSATAEQITIWKHIKNVILQPAGMREISNQGSRRDWINIEEFVRTLDPLFDSAPGENSEPEQSKDKDSD